MVINSIKTWLHDRPVLRQPIVMLSSVLLVVIVLLSVASWYHHIQTDVLKQAKQVNQQARKRLQVATQERAMVLQYLPAYQQLQRLGFFHSNHRQQWVEQLKSTQQQYRLLPIDY